jgi:monoamine oxidase
MAKYDIIIIGAGPAGLATAYYCAQQNKRVLIVDQAEIANQEGSSAGLSRHWRLQYSQDHLAKLTKATEPLWAQLEEKDEVIEPLIEKVGSLWFGAADVDTTEGEIEQTEKVMTENGTPFTAYGTSAELTTTFGIVDLPPSYRGFFQPGGGSINVRKTIINLQKLCKDTDLVRFQTGQAVTGIMSSEAGCSITISNAIEHEADKIIICAGPYTRKVLSMLDIQLLLPLEEWSSAYFKIKNDKTETVPSAAATTELLPRVYKTTWFAFQKGSEEDPGLYYGFPESAWEMPGHVRIGAAFTFRRITDPEQSLRLPDPTAIALIEKYVQRHLPCLEPIAIKPSVCLANPTPDENFVLDYAPPFVPGNRNVIIFTGSWSFKFVPMVGKLCAGLATTGSGEQDISHFNLTRLLSKDCQHVSLLMRGLTPLFREPRASKNVIIVGAGIAGLTAGYLLKGAGFKVQILEANTRVGGRIYTARKDAENQDFSAGQFAEMGAMRVPTEHRRVRTLIKQFELKTEPFIYEDAEENGLIVMNGQRLTRSEYKKKPALLGFRGLSIFEADNTAEKLLDEALQSLLLTIVRDPDNGWNSLIRKYGHLSMMGYLREHTTLSPEAIYKINMLLNMEGTHMSSLIEAMRDQADLSPNNKFYKISGGMDQLPESFLVKGGLAENVLYGRKVVTIDRTGPKVKIIVKNTTHPGEETYEADYVIVTTTFSALSYIHVTPPFSQQKRQAITSLHYDNSVKIYLQFNRKFWEEGEKPIYGGFTISDSGLRFTYYPSPEAGTPYGMVLASYTWGSEAQKWEGLTNEQRIYKALEYLGRVHGIDLVKAGIFVRGYSHSWQNDPYAIGAFALFNPYQEADLARAIRQPEGQIHFAGEHASARHAWIEGAVESAVDAALAIHNAVKLTQSFISPNTFRVSRAVGLLSNFTPLPPTIPSVLHQYTTLLGARPLDDKPTSHQPYSNTAGLLQFSLFSRPREENAPVVHSWAHL